MMMTTPGSRSVLVASLALISLSATHAAQPASVTLTEPITNGGSVTTHGEALITLTKGLSSSYVAFGAVLTNGGAPLIGQGSLINSNGDATDDPDWHVESGFAAITTDLTNFPTWTTDRTEAGGEALIGGQEQGEQAAPDDEPVLESSAAGKFYTVVQVTKLENSKYTWRDRIYCFGTSVLVNPRVGTGAAVTLDTGFYVDAVQEGDQIVFSTPTSFMVNNPPQDVREFLADIKPRLQKLGVPLPLDPPPPN